MHAALSRTALAGTAAAVLAGCAREDEAGMRDRLERWFALGATAYFAARGDCAVAVFHLRDDRIGAAMPVTGSVGEMLYALPRRGAAALDDPGQAPDAALVDLANAERATGMAMRRVGLEARACMSDDAEGDFHRVLTSPEAVLAYDTETGTLMLMDRGRRRLLAAMGAG